MEKIFIVDIRKKTSRGMTPAEHGQQTKGYHERGVGERGGREGRKQSKRGTSLTERQLHHRPRGQKSSIANKAELYRDWGKGKRKSRLRKGNLVEVG